MGFSKPLKNVIHMINNILTFTTLIGFAAFPHLLCYADFLDNGKESYTKLCRERALKYFDRKDNNEAYFNLYERLLAK